MSTHTPKKPSPDQFEAAVAAMALCYGYFIETRHTLKSENRRDIMELDVLASKHRNRGESSRTLIEAKSSENESVLGTIFKVGGQIKYLDIQQGHIVFSRKIGKDEFACANIVGQKLGVTISIFDTNASPRFNQIKELDRLTSNVDDQNLSLAFDIAWHQQIAERICANSLQHRIKSHPEKEVLLAIRKYKESCEASLFEKNPIRRLLSLHDAFSKSPKIPLKCANTVSKNKNEAKEVIKKALQTHEYSWIQYAMTLEMRSKLLSIKCCFEHIAEHGTAWEAAIRGLSLPQALPPTYISSMQSVASKGYHPNCPYILQIYIQLLGGFIVDDNDYIFLQAVSGANRAEVEQALKLFDLFFPIDGSWFTPINNINALKLVPGYMRGIGAFFRNHTRGQKDYDQLTPNGNYTLGKWHDAAYHVLESNSDLKL